MEVIFVDPVGSDISVSIRKFTPLMVMVPVPDIDRSFPPATVILVSMTPSKPRAGTARVQRKKSRTRVMDTPPGDDGGWASCAPLAPDDSRNHPQDSRRNRAVK